MPLPPAIDPRDLAPAGSPNVSRRFQPALRRLFFIEAL